MTERRLQLNKDRSRILAMLLAFVLLVQLLPVPARATDDDLPGDAHIYQLNAGELARYAAAFASSETFLKDDNTSCQTNQYDLLELSTSGEGFFLDEGHLGEAFAGIGTPDRPFRGTIAVASSATGADKIYLDRALFGCLTTEVEIVDSYGGTADAITLGSSRQLTLIPTTDLSTPLFAEHVKNGGAEATWQIGLSPYTQDATKTEYTYGGLIGTVWPNAQLNVTFTNDTATAKIANEDVTFRTNVSRSGDNVGLICGTLGQNAELTVTLSGTNTSYSVSALGGAAGGLVGAMRSGSVLTPDSLEGPIITTKNGTTTTTITTDYSAYTVSVSAAVGRGVSMMTAAPKRTVKSDYKTDADAEPALTVTRGLNDAYGTDADTEPVGTLTRGLNDAYGTDADAEPALTTKRGPNDAYKTGKDTKPALRSPAPLLRSGTPRSRSYALTDGDQIDPRTNETNYAFTGCAGGLVGWAENASIYMANGKTVTVKGTVSGSTASGGVFGLYDAEALASLPAEATAATYLPYHATTHLRFAPDVYTVTANLRGSGNGGLIGNLCGALDITVADATANAYNGTAHLKPSLAGDNKSRGGVIGNYITDTLTHTLEITNLKVNPSAANNTTNHGGLIGKISDDQAAYVYLHDLTVINSGTLGGGLVGNMGSAGSFVDVRGGIYLKGKADGGLVGTMNAGVLRLQGVTDMGNRKSVADGSMETTTGQIVGTRGDGLVYAVGTGSDSDAAAGWTFYRAAANRKDDVGDWGEVLRIDGTDLALGDGTGENGAKHVLTEDLTTAHTVTVRPASTAMGTKAQFAKTALNIQLNTAENRARSTGALRFADTTTNTSTALLEDDLSLTADIDLSGTGLTGFTRDNGANAAFTGTLNGDGHTLTLATGETWGQYTDDTVAKGAGRIYNHTYTGLFAKTGSGAAIQNLTVKGEINVRMTESKEYRIGALAAESSGALTLENCVLGSAALPADKLTVTTTIVQTGSQSRVGGAVGKVNAPSSGEAVVTIKGGSYVADIIDLRSANECFDAYFGGVFGFVPSAGGTLTITVNPTPVAPATDGRTTLAGGFSNAAATMKTYARYGGFIGYIQPRTIPDEGTTDNTKRVVNLRNLDVGAMNIDVTTNEAGGGLLGFQWLNAQVNIGTAGGTDGIVVGAAEDTLNNGSYAASPNVKLSGAAQKMGGLVFRATGEWKIHDLLVRHARFTPNTDGKTDFGFVAALSVIEGKNQLGTQISFDQTTQTGNAYRSALLLELCGRYQLPADLVPGSSAKLNVYDEVLAYSVPVLQGALSERLVDNSYRHYFEDQTIPADVTENGAAVVSVRASYEDSGTVYAVRMDGANCNTYQNQTTYGQSAAYNPNTRYYYNLDKVIGKASPTDGEKLLLWSLTKYAHENIRARFTGGFSNDTLSGTMDMTGLSYYPVNASGVTVSGTLTFKNKEIEAGEAQTGNSDSFARSTRYHQSTTVGENTTVTFTQHYLMHAGLLLNCPGSLTVPAAGLTLAGSVGVVGGLDGSGFLVCGTLGGAQEMVTVSLGKLRLDGASVGVGDSVSGNAGSVTTSTVYAPLLIHQIGSQTTLTVSDVRAEGNTSYATLIAADGYAATSLIGKVGGASASNLNLTFSKIVLDARKAGLSDNGAESSTALNSAYGTTRTVFSRATLLESFAYSSSGRGTYNYTYDEDWGTGSVDLHKREVTYGYEVSESTENRGEEQKYYGETTPGGRFTDPMNSANTALVHSFAGWLPYVAVPYSAQSSTHELKVNVPAVTGKPKSGCGTYNDPYVFEDGAALSAYATLIAGGDFTETILLPNGLNTDGSIDSMWCANKESHAKYSLDNGYFKAAGKPDLPKDAVRKYLAGAYYVIDSTDPITLHGSFPGFGALDSSVSNYNNPYAFRGVIKGNTGAEVIVNPTNNPLITSSNGSVVKGLTVKVQNATVAISEENTFTFDYAGLHSYGAVIGQVMGGDNIIDNVALDLSGLTVTEDSTAYRRLKPVGGYIGVVVNGGVVFRNMPDAAASAPADSALKAKTDRVTDSGYLYVNPIIGRVIAGYAFSEGYPVNNGTKNYEIPQLDADGVSGGLSVDGSAISITGGRGLWVLGAIVNSGAASATSATGNYATINSGEWLSAYRLSTATHAGDYDGVGTDANSSTDYANDAVWYSGDKALVPYVIRQYTAASSGDYPARSVGGASGTWTVSLPSSGSLTVPAGFRGLGSIYTTQSAWQLAVSALNGNGSTVTLAMKYLEYDATATGENYKAAENTAGFGLINSTSAAVTVSSLTLSGSVSYDLYNCALGTKITKYAWGFNSANTYNYNYSLVTELGLTAADNMKAATILSTGGLIGYARGAVTTDGVSMNGLSVDGAKFVGGMVGRLNGAALSVTAPSSTQLEVHGGVNAGGIFGRREGNGAALTIQATSNASDTTTKTTMELKQVSVKGAVNSGKFVVWADQDDKDYNEATYFSAGGLGGCVESDNKTAVPIIVKQIQLTGYNPEDDSTPVHVWAENATPVLNNARWKSAVGGMFGSLFSRMKDQYTVSVTVDRCDVNGLNIRGDMSGGLIGIAIKPATSTYTKVTVQKGTGYTENFINGGTQAGGLFGMLLQFKAFSMTGVQVKNYTIKTSVDEYCTVPVVNNANGRGTAVEREAAGGLCGEMYSSQTITLANSRIEGCTINAGASAAKAPNDHGAGGVVGLTNSTPTIQGSNVLLKDLVIKEGKTKATDKRMGFFAGKNTPNFKIAGLSVQNVRQDSASGTVMDKVCYNTDSISGYIAFADCGGTASGTTLPASLSGLDHDDDVDDADPADPYVTVNPQCSIGGTGHVVTLTGDGAVNSLTALRLDDDNTVNVWDSPPYQYSVKKSGNAYVTAAAKDFTDKNVLSSFSTFNTQMPNCAVTNDIAVLVLETTVKSISTKTINACLNLLANTAGYDSSKGFNFAQDEANIYSVDVYRVTYSNGAFTATLDDGTAGKAASLKRANGYFYVESDDVDNMQNSFSLIDVKFCNPASTGEVAYHLYFPVFVKKLLEYDFDVAALSGTRYVSGNYAFGENRTDGNSPLIENLGTPVTLQLRYTYERTVAQWQKALDLGDNLLQNFEKKLTMSYNKNSSIDGTLAGDTLLVLVDPMDSGSTPYYARYSAACSGATRVNDSTYSATLDLSAFEDAAGNAFCPVTFNDCLNITATKNNSTGTFLKLGDSTGATVRVGSDYYRLATEDDPSGDRYVLTVTGIKEGASRSLALEQDGAAVPCIAERYYLSIFTEMAANQISHYQVSTPETFAAMAGSNKDSRLYPHKLKEPNQIVTGSGIIHVVLGDIFDQTFNVLGTTSSNGTQQMSGENRELKTSLDVTVSLKTNAAGHVSSYLANASYGVNVYQSFVQMLTRTEGSDVSRRIRGEPTVTGRYKLVDPVAKPAAGSGAVTVSDILADETIAATSYTPDARDTYVVFGIPGALNSWLTVNGVRICSETVVEYSADEIPDEYPARPEEGDSINGVTVSAESHVGFDPAHSELSKNVSNGVEESPLVYYSIAAPENAKLDLRVVPNSDNAVGDYAQLGLNSNRTWQPDSNATTVTVKASADYDISPILAMAEAGDYDYIQCTMKLQRRLGTTNTYAPIYDDPATQGDDSLAFATYFGSMKINNGTATLNQSGDRYTIVIQRPTDAYIRIPVEFTVFTGKKLKDENPDTDDLFANYRLTMSVELYKGNGSGGVTGSSLNGSKAESYIVYTNAKVYPDFITNSGT